MYEIISATFSSSWYHMLTVDSVNVLSSSGLLFQSSHAVYQFLSGAAITPNTTFLSLKHKDARHDYHSLVVFASYVVTAHDCRQRLLSSALQPHSSCACRKRWVLLVVWFTVTVVLLVLSFLSCFAELWVRFGHRTYDQAVIGPIPGRAAIKLPGSSHDHSLPPPVSVN